ncbi:hypothetical protein H6F46_08275 [Limnothrix sp. FACHB-1083]|uniref:hypothetical protein n=1 Tax=unclassified Limnothrix TaxID=2632864 RepID=UPI0016815065|nr:MULTISPECIES: hypothetical protein [unclassified Limnothrix]MBD2160689.1 hypothetical protein [Limnothrix sp. FACHB-1083]MBD2191468.1 hypothetical protein [Limnothrix sp. FACHB-1088]
MATLGPLKQPIQPFVTDWSGWCAPSRFAGFVHHKVHWQGATGGTPSDSAMVSGAIALAQAYGVGAGGSS